MSKKQNEKTEYINAKRRAIRYLIELHINDDDGSTKQIGAHSKDQIIRELCHHIASTTGDVVSLIDFTKHIYHNDGDLVGTVCEDECGMPETWYEQRVTCECLGSRRMTKKLMGLKVSGTRAQCIERLERSQDVMSYRGHYYYRCTLPNRALNRTRDGYNLFRVENGVHILEAIE